MSEGRLMMFDAPVRRATVFEDRAELVREAHVSVPAGRVVLQAVDLSPLLSDAHLTARLVEEIPGVHVEDVRLERSLQRAVVSAERSAALLADLDAAERALAHAERAYNRAKQRRDASLKLLTRYASQAAKALWTPAGAAGWREGLSRLEEALDDAERAISAAVAERDKAAEAHRAQAAMVREADERPPRLRSTLTVRISAAEAARITLEITSLSACALWRPAHEAHLDAEGELRWVTLATVWQRTGEDWQDVTLTLSTDRPGGGAHLPGLRPDELRLQAKAARRRVVLAHREEATRRGDDGVVPGVYDGGEARAFAVSDPVSVPSNGRPYRVATGGFTAAARLNLEARPAVDPHVHWIASARNVGGSPLLAGPVTLLRDGAYVGVGAVPYVGPGEAFEIGFGSDDRWRLTARRSREVEERRLGRDRVHFVTHVEVRYAGVGAASADLVLRLPKSEIDQLQVKPSKAWCSEGLPQPDADGLVRLPVELEPGARQTVSLGFYFDTSGEVVLPDPW